MNCGYPDRKVACCLLADAESCNPGPWGDHSRIAALCAERIAQAAGMDPEKAYVLGLLHDIGRKFGIRHLSHVYDGYHYMMELNYPVVAKVCLTHSFNLPALDIYIGRTDITPDQVQELEGLLADVVYDDYDRLVQLCDCLAGSDGVVDMEERMLDVKHRYGSYPQEKWDHNMWLKRYFEEKTGNDIYEIVKKQVVI